MIQHLVFQMPQDQEMQMAAMAAIEAYVFRLHDLKYRTQIALVMKESWLTDVLVPPAFRIFDTVEQACNWLPIVDLIVPMNDADALVLAKPTGKSLATGFGIILGFENVGELPKPIGPKPEVEWDVCIWGEGIESIAEKLANMILVSCNMRVIIAYSPCDALFKSEMVIGRHSAYTYLAACYNRAVIDIILTEEKALYDKWSSGRWYKMEVDSEEKFAENGYLLLLRSFERLKEHEFKRRRLNGQ